MNEYNLFQAVTGVNWIYVIAGLILLASFIVMINKLVAEFCGVLEKRLGIKIVTDKSNDHELLLDAVKAISELSKKQSEDVKQSILHDKAIKDQVRELSGKLDKLIQTVEIMQMENDETTRSKLKNDISRAYQLYSNRTPAPYFSSMEKETLEDLIKSYELHKGENSFVHSVVQKEMYTWKVID